MGLQNLWLKDESRNPTASFKDRASAIVVARAQEIGAEVVVTASTGQRGRGARRDVCRGGAKSDDLCPQVRAAGEGGTAADLRRESDSGGWNLRRCVRSHHQSAKEFGWYCRNTGYNPFTAEGKKTAAFEIWEWWQDAHAKWHEEFGEDLDHAPLTVFVSVGDGNIISGIHKGFKDLLQLGWLPRMPRIIGVQAEGSAAISNAFHGNTETITPVSATTIADSISVDLPRDGVRAVRAAKETGGTYVNVSDRGDPQAPSRNSAGSGVFAEPAGAAAYAGLVKGISFRLGGRRRSDPGVEYRQRTQRCPRGDEGSAVRADH